MSIKTITATLRTQPLCWALGAVFLTSCAVPQQSTISTGHIQERQKPPSSPPPIVRTLAPPPVDPENRKKIKTYSIVVKDVDIQDLLFSIARDAKIDVDISPDVKGTVTLNAVNQSLPQILDRLSANFDITYEVIDEVYRITPDKPVLKSYRVEYPNITRTSKSETRLSSLDPSSGAGSSSTEVTTTSTNEFWKTLTKNIEDILRDTDKELVLRKKLSNNSSNALRKKDSKNNNSKSALENIVSNVVSPENQADDDATSQETLLLYASQVIINPEAGILQVRATQRQHAKVKEFLDLILASSQRQVLIEATIAEVQLSQKYEKGIDWAYLRKLSNGKRSRSGNIGFGSNFSNNVQNGINASSPYPLGSSSNSFEIGLRKVGRSFDFLSSVRLLEEFGKVKVLSSPKLSVLNNQTALLKVTDQVIYFTVDVAVTEATQTTAEKRTYTSNLKEVPVGFVMSVTPYIGNDGVVQLNLRPSISRVIDYATDPGPQLAGQNFNNLIPIIRSREIESIMRVADGNIAVLGGLMEDTITGDLAGLPGLTKSAAGAVLANQTDNRVKKELVIFIRPRVVKNADLQGDYVDFQRYILGNDQFQASHPALEKQ